ncbi:MAG: Ig-like domain-containing protein, partial [Bergeyella sp.]
MKKLLLVLFLLSGYIHTFSQLDREHWFAPMMNRNTQTTTPTLYLSTNQTTAFPVYIYNNETLIGTVTISKGSPGVYAVTSSYIITTTQSDLFTTSTKGLHLKADYPFFANLRLGSNTHAEIITSKGQAGLGTEFYAAPAPLVYNSSSSVHTFMTSIIATENNTTVTVSGYSSSVVFSNGSTGTTSFTVNLNKGQSYIIDGTGGNSNNRTGFIGAKIVSDKAISVTNGNFNGQYASSVSNSDILMDQSVPTDKLGNEFALVKGNGDPSYGMERAYIVATKPNTTITVNGTYLATISNAGGYFQVLSPYYINQGSSHYNMHIKTSENVYVFQLMAGSSSTSAPYSSGGYNYIPPLNCYLPKKIDEIGLINQISSSSTYTTKLNIITEKGATVTVNGATPAATYGPFSLTGNSQWVTYSIPNVTGNQTIVSSKAVTAGLSAGDDNVGYGGYFAGFSSTPLITKTLGECLPGVRLEVTEGFDSYQWLIKNTDGTYSNAPGTNNLYYYEPTQAGYYAVKVKAGSCDGIQTADFKFQNCVDYTNTDYPDVCSTFTITPSFELSSQTVNPATVKIETQPAKGTAVVNADGTITYTANAGASGTDTFRYSFCGAATIPDCEDAKATITINQIVGQDAILRECSSTGVATYDLSTANVSSDTTYTKVYYNTLAGAQNETASDVISNFTEFSSADTTVYVRVKNSKNCFNIYKIELKSKANPVVNADAYTTAHCDEEDGIIDGNYVVNPSTITPSVLANPANFTVTYYDTEAKANAGGTDNISGNYVFTPATASIWIRVVSSEGCVTVKEIPLTVGSKIPFLENPLDKDVCDKELDNTEPVNLADYLPLLTSETSLTVNYYSTMPDALSGQNAVSASQTLTMGTPATFYYVIKNANYCSDVATVNLTLIMGGFKSETLEPSYTTCEDSTATLDAGTAHTGFKWYNENNPTVVIGTSQTITVPPGNYFVILTSPNQCDYKQEVEVVGSPKAQLTTSAYTAMHCDDDLDGKIDITFSTDVTPIIIPNYDSSLYTVTYYTNPAMTGTPLPDVWSYSADTTVYVKVTSVYCATLTGQIDFKIGGKFPLLTTVYSDTICDEDYSGSETVDLKDYRQYFWPSVTADYTVHYYKNLSDAQNAQNELPSSVVELSEAESVYYLRFVGPYCPNIGEVRLKFTEGFKSETLQPSYPICEDSTITLDAGTAHTGFKWYNETDPNTVIGTSQTITVPPGKYFVILTSSDGCDYTQNVEVIGSPKANLITSAYVATHCDDDLDGKIDITFSTDVTPIIIPNYDSSLYTVTYYTNPAMTGTPLPDVWSYSADTTVYVKVTSAYCAT